MIRCPVCQSEDYKKNGHIHTGKQRYKCLDCGRQFVENPGRPPVSLEKKTLIDKLLLERLPLAGIARVAGVAESWVQGYVNKKIYRPVPHNRTNTLATGAVNPRV